MIAPSARPGLVRTWFALTALTVLLAVGSQLVLTATGDGGFFERPLYRTLNLLVFFTIQSNLLVGLSALLLALHPGRSTPLRRWLRLTSLVAIVVTGVVYHVALAGYAELMGWAWVSDQLLHTVVPVMTVLGWLLLGPRGWTGWRVVGLSLVFPLLWLVLTLLRGLLVVGFWPYPFVDVDRFGLGQVLVNCGIVALLFVALAAGAHLVDRPLARLAGSDAADASHARP